jgi:non-canonical purine NTP pyrophosphatase (RdgB/HAM1 family)
MAHMKIVLASNNAGKLAELQTLFSPLDMTLVRQSELNIPEAAEPFKTFVENALAKARHAAHLSGLPALADDAGLCVDAFGGQPGVDTAYYATTPTSPLCWSKCRASKVPSSAAPPWSARWWRCAALTTRSL